MNLRVRRVTAESLSAILSDLNAVGRVVGFVRVEASSIRIVNGSGVVKIEVVCLQILGPKP